MKIAIPVNSKQKDEQISNIFGRCPYFAIYDDEEGEVTYIDNPGFKQPRGAGINAAQMLVNQGVNYLYSANIGPKASRVLNEGSIKVEDITQLTVNQIINKVNEN